MLFLTNEEYYKLNGTLTPERIEKLIDYEEKVKEITKKITRFCDENHNTYFQEEKSWGIVQEFDELLYQLELDTNKTIIIEFRDRLEGLIDSSCIAECQVNKELYDIQLLFEDLG